MRKQLTALLTALFLLLSGAAAWADYTEWKDSSYPFSAVKTIYLDQVDTAQVENLSPVEEWKLTLPVIFSHSGLNRSYRFDGRSSSFYYFGCWREKENPFPGKIDSVEGGLIIVPVVDS